MSQQNIPLFPQNAGVPNPLWAVPKKLTQLNSFNGKSTGPVLLKFTQELEETGEYHFSVLVAVNTYFKICSF
jgi:hypothetical protein